MRIAYIIPSLANKGPIIMVKTLIDHLVLNGYLCDVYYFDNLVDLDFPCPTRKITFFESIDFNNYDIIHSHLFRPDVYCSFHRRKIKRSSAIVITTIHTAIYDDLDYAFGKLISSVIVPIWRSAWKRIDHAVVLTEAAKEYYQRTKFKSLSVISNGWDVPSRFQPMESSDLELIRGLKKKHILLGTVCAIDKRKGLEQVVKLLVLNKNYAFIVVGDGKEKVILDNLAKHYGVDSRVKIIGFRPDGYRYMPYFDMFVLPSRSEGMPIALLEAIALKVPVVCADILSLSKDFSDQELSYFELDNIQSLEDACEQSRSNSDLFVDRAYIRYQRKHTTAQMGINYRKLYDSLMNIS